MTKLEIQAYYLAAVGLLFTLGCFIAGCAS